MIDDPLNRTKVKRGEELPHSKLTDDDVRSIREMMTERSELYRRAASLSNRAIAAKFDVHVRTIDRISNGETWGHVE